MQSRQQIEIAVLRNMKDKYREIMGSFPGKNFQASFVETAQLIAKHHLTRESALDVAELITPIFVTLRHDSLFRKSIVKKFIYISEHYRHFDVLNQMMTNFLGAVQNGQFSEGDMCFFEQVKADNLPEFCSQFARELQDYFKEKECKFEKMIAEGLSQQYSALSFTETLPLEKKQELTAQIMQGIPRLNDAKIEKILQLYKRVFSVPVFWWSSMTDIITRLRLDKADGHLVISTLCALIKGTQLTVHHISLLKYIRSVNDCDYFMEKIVQNSTLLAELNQLERMYPALFQNKPTIEIMLNRFSFLTKLDDLATEKENLSFRGKVVQLILRVPEGKRNKFVEQLQLVLSKNQLSFQEIEFLDHVDSDQLLPFFDDPIENFKKLIRFDLNETSDFRYLFKRYPEDVVSLIQGAIEHLVLTSGQLSDITYQLSKKLAQSKSMDERRLIEELCCALAEKLFGCIYDLSGEGKKNQYHIVLQFLIASGVYRLNPEHHAHTLFKYVFHFLFFGDSVGILSDKKDVYDILLNRLDDFKKKASSNVSLLPCVAYILLKAKHDQRDDIIKVLTDCQFTLDVVSISLMKTDKSFWRSALLRDLSLSDGQLVEKCMLTAIRNKEDIEFFNYLLKKCGLEMDQFLNELISKKQWKDVVLLTRYIESISEKGLRKLLEKALTADSQSDEFIAVLLSKFDPAEKLDKERFLYSLVKKNKWQEAVKWFNHLKCLTDDGAASLLLRAVADEQVLFISKIKQSYNPSFSLVSVCSQVHDAKFSNKQWRAIMVYGLKAMCVEYSEIVSQEFNVSHLFFQQFAYQAAQRMCHKLGSLLSGIERNGDSFDVKSISFEADELLQLTSGWLKPVYQKLKSTGAAPEALARIRDVLQNEIPFYSAKKQ